MVEAPTQILAAWGFERASTTPVEVGLINQTFHVVTAAGAGYALQRLHQIFTGELNLDIEAVTDHLAAAGIATPRIVRTKGGDAWVADEAGAVWRVLTWLDGRVVERVQDPAMARAAARQIARFHGALTDLEHTFRFTRPGAHDTARHMAHLEEAVATCSSHPRFDVVHPVAARILALHDTLPVLGELPRRIIHGDLKITNVLFDEALQGAVALIDLDTLAYGTIAVELGDALRSWCNPAGEDAPEAAVDISLFRGAVEGYAEVARDSGTAGLTDAEASAIVPGLETITLELSSRFCADALEEPYFGWNSKKFSSRSEHNLIRATGQLTLAESIRKNRDKLQQIVSRAFTPGGDRSRHGRTD